LGHPVCAEHFVPRPVAQKHGAEALGILDGLSASHPRMECYAKLVRGAAYYELGDHRRATAEWEAVAQSPDVPPDVSAPALYNISLIEALRGEYEQAVSRVAPLHQIRPGYQRGFFDALAR